MARNWEQVFGQTPWMSRPERRCKQPFRGCLAPVSGGGSLSTRRRGDGLEAEMDANEASRPIGDGVRWRVHYTRVIDEASSDRNALLGH